MSTVKSARTYYTILGAIFIVCEILFLMEVIANGDGDFFGVSIKTLFFLVFVGLTYLGFNWAKWALTILLLLYSIACLIAGFEIPSLSMKLIALYYILFALLPHFSVRLKPLTKSTSKYSSNKKVFVEPKPIVTPTKDFDFPYLIDRYKSMLIDFLLLFVFVVACVKLNERLDLESTWILVIYLVIALSYEPVLTTYSATIGQRMMNIRVRNIDDPNKRINLGQAYLRFISKGLLGWLSFITMNMNSEKRAIHDFLASSVVVEAEKGV